MIQAQLHVRLVGFVAVVHFGSLGVVCQLNHYPGCAGVDVVLRAGYQALTPVQLSAQRRPLGESHPHEDHLGVEPQQADILEAALHLLLAQCFDVR